MRIVLASTNRAKQAAAQSVISRIFPQAQLAAAPSQIALPAQPIGDAETQAAAVARARAAAVAGVDLALGLEGGVRETVAGWALCSWAAVVDSRGLMNIGGGAVIVLPQQVVEQVLAGEELGPLIDHLAGLSGTRHGPGAVGILTGGLIERRHLFEDALICALAPWITPGYFDRSPASPAPVSH